MVINRNDPQNEWWSYKPANCKLKTSLHGGKPNLAVPELSFEQSWMLEKCWEQTWRRNLLCGDGGIKRIVEGTLLVLCSSSAFWGTIFPVFFEGWMLIGFSSTKHTSSSSNIPLAPGYCSLPCYRVHAAGQCPARPDRELPAKKQKTQVAPGGRLELGWTVLASRAIPQGVGYSHLPWEYHLPISTRQAKGWNNIIHNNC